MLVHTYRLPENLVPHPRFGTSITASGYHVPNEDIIKSSGHYGSSVATLFPESAIPADLSRQKYTVIPRNFYFDQLEKCRDCERPFLFFAREQKYWYEDLGFSINARCVRCTECRKAKHQLRQGVERYSLLIKKDPLSDVELATLVGEAVKLSKAGILRKEQRLRRLKNLALARIPEDPVTQEILAWLAEMPRSSMVAVTPEPESAGQPDLESSGTNQQPGEVLALSWEPNYEMFYSHAKALMETGMVHREIRALFSSLTEHSTLGGDFGQMTRDVQEAIEDALARRPVRSMKLPER